MQSRRRFRPRRDRRPLEQRRRLLAGLPRASRRAIRGRRVRGARRPDEYRIRDLALLIGKSRSRGNRQWSDRRSTRSSRSSVARLSAAARTELSRSNSEVRADLDNANVRERLMQIFGRPVVRAVVGGDHVCEAPSARGDGPSSCRRAPSRCAPGSRRRSRASMRSGSAISPRTGKGASGCRVANERARARSGSPRVGNSRRRCRLPK